MGEAAKQIRIPLVTDLSLGVGDISSSGNALISEFFSYMKNLCAYKLSSGSVVARVRPPLIGVVTNNTANADGRGIYVWEDNGFLYFVNNDTIYRSTYSFPVGTITAGTQRTHFTQVGTRLLITDPQNNQAWTLQTDHTLIQVTDADFPTSLCAGAVTLNGRGYVMDDDGFIYGSASEDATSWDALDVLNAERSPDRGVYLGLHHDHIVAFGSRSIEFFYDNGNATGSVLKRRDDLSYNIGAVLGDAVWQFRDEIYFLAKDFHGSMSIYKLSNFGLVKLSKDDLDAVLELTTIDGSDYVYISGIQGLGKSFILVTLSTTGFASPSNYGNGYYTFAYDVDYGIWSIFETALSNDDVFGNIFPLVSWAHNTSASSNQKGYGIFADGNIFSVDYAAFADTTFAGTVNAISVEVLTGWQDGGTNKYKYCPAMEVVGNASDDVTLTLSYSDTTNLSSAYTVSRTISMLASATKRKITRLGRFLRRNFRLSASVTDDLRLEALELEVGRGDV